MYERNASPIESIRASVGESPVQSSAKPEKLATAASVLTRAIALLGRPHGRQIFERLGSFRTLDTLEHPRNSERRQDADDDHNNRQLE